MSTETSAQILPSARRDQHIQRDAETPGTPRPGVPSRAPLPPTAVRIRQQPPGVRVPTPQDRRGSRKLTPPPPERGLVAKLQLRFKRITSRKGVKHLIAANERFTERLGNAFAGAITYFSFLSLVPILLVAFSVAGFVLASRPDLLESLQTSITQQVPSLSDQLGTAVNGAVAARGTAGVLGLLLALYAGIGWMGNVRDAIQAQMRPVWGKPESATESAVKLAIKDLGYLAGLALALIATIAITALAGAAQNLILGWLGLDDVGWLKPVLTVVAILIAMAADTLIFYWVYSVLPGKRLKETFQARIRGAIAAAVAFEILKFALTFIIEAITGSATGAVFGVVVGLLFFFNLTARIVLFIAAWVATAPGGPQAPEEHPEDRDGEVPVMPIAVRRELSGGKAVVFAALGAVAGAVGVAGSRRRQE